MAAEVFLHGTGQRLASLSTFPPSYVFAEAPFPFWQKNCTRVVLFHSGVRFGAAAGSSS